MLEHIVHTSDISNQVRETRIAKTWINLLFEECFAQGDRETEMEGELSISFLCDRTTTRIASTQPGFINFCIIPLIDCLCQLSPETEYLRRRAEKHAKYWAEYKETSDDIELYANHTVAKLDEESKLWLY